jgi:hypothetical protein
LTGCLRLFDTFLRCVNTCNNVYYMYKTEWILEGSSNCCLNFALYYNSNYWIGILPMVFWPPLSMHGISTPLPMVFWLTCRWYIDPPTHGILTPYPWYFDPPTHGISTPYTWYFDLPAYLLIRNGGSKYHGGSIYHTGGSVFNKGVQYTMDENWPRGQFTMGFKIPYDTGTLNIG